MTLMHKNNSLLNTYTSIDAMLYIRFLGRDLEENKLQPRYLILYQFDRWPVRFSLLNSKSCSEWWNLSFSLSPGVARFYCRSTYPTFDVPITSNEVYNIQSVSRNQRETTRGFKVTDVGSTPTEPTNVPTIAWRIGFGRQSHPIPLQAYSYRTNPSLILLLRAPKFSDWMILWTNRI
jgi:hypothetical protein